MAKKKGIPEVRIDNWPHGVGNLDNGPPYNLQFPFDGEWSGLGSVGTNTFGGPGSCEVEARYRAEVRRVMSLLLQAHDMFKALKWIETYVNNQPLDSLAQFWITKTVQDAVKKIEEA